MIQILKRTSLVLLGLSVVQPLWANDLSVTSAAAMFNTAPGQTCTGDGQPGPCGLEVTVDANDTSPVFVSTNSPQAETGVRISFFLNPNGSPALDLPPGQWVRIGSVLSTFPKPPNASSVEHIVFFIQRNFQDNNYRLRVVAQQNFGFFATCATAFLVVDNGPDKKVTIEWVQGQGQQGSQDGRCSLFIDDVLQGQKTNLNTSEFVVNELRIGFQNSADPPNTSGTYYIDEVVISRL